MANDLRHEFALQVHGITHAFGGNRVLNNVELDVKAGSVTALIGPNGSGKTTLFNVISGFLKPQSGQIFCAGRDVTSDSVAKRSVNGLMRTFQAPQLFSDLSVLDNVVMGLYKEGHGGFLSDLFLPRRARRAVRDAKITAGKFLEEHGMGHVADQLGSELPAGQQRNVELIRAAISDPYLLLLDEPTSGLTADEVNDFMSVVRKLNTDGTTIFLVSHDVRVVAEMSSIAYVLNFGDVIAVGTPKEIQADKQVRDIYLGNRTADSVKRTADEH